MKVKEQIEQLSKLEQDIEVIGYTEDKRILPDEHMFSLFHIENTTVGQGEWTRHEDIPSMAFNSEPGSVRVVLLNMTNDF